MLKVKDRTLLGVIAGLAGSGIVLVLQHAALKAGWITKTWAEQAEGATVSRKYLRTRSAAALGWLTSMSINGFAGVAQTYVLAKTGRDHLWVKSTGLGIFKWLLLHGMSNRLTQAFKADDSPPRNAFGSCLSAVLDSCITGVIIAELGHESLFPEHDAQTLSNMHRPDPASQLAALNQAHRQQEASWTRP